MRPARTLAAGGSLLLLALLVTRPVPAVRPLAVRPVPGRVLSLHVVANSNSPRDQAVKLAVRDRLLPELSHLLRPAVGLRSGEALLRSHLGQLTATADGVLSTYGVPYQARVKLGWARYPAKAFGTLVFPAGRYQALQVLLGKAKGHNWWCVLFPNLCLAPPGVAVQKTEPLLPHQKPIRPALHRQRPVSRLALYRGHARRPEASRRTVRHPRPLVNRLWNDFLRFW